MARKTRRQKQRAAARQAAPIRATALPSGQTGTPAAPVADVELADFGSADDAFDGAADDESAELASEVPSALRDEPAATATPAAAVPTPATTTAAPSATAASATGAPVRRRIERLSQATQTPTRAARPGRGPSNAAALFQPLDSEDAAIPFDRVPYVPADLRRVLLIAALMVVLIIIAAVVVTHVVH